MRNRALYLALRVAAAVFPVLPLRLTYAAADMLAWIVFWTVAPLRRTTVFNQSVVRPAAGTRAWHRTGLRALQTNARNWIDTLRIPRLSAAQIVDMVQIDGWEHLEEALSAGRGVVLASMHLGNFDFVGQAVVGRGVHVTVPVERIEPQELFAFLTGLREADGIRTVPLDQAARAMVTGLRAGGAVAIVADRFLGGRGVEVELCGLKLLFPSGPASLARHTGAPVVLGVGVRAGFNRYRGVVYPIAAAGEQKGERETMQALADAMTQLIRTYPDQWLAFGPVWPDSIVKQSPGTIGQQTKAAV